MSIKTSLYTAAIIAFAFSLNATADPGKPQSIYSGLLAPSSSGYKFQCHVVNTSDVGVPYSIEIFDRYGGVLESYETADGEVLPPLSSQTIVLIESNFLLHPAQCVIRWVGQEGDMRGTFCTMDSIDNGNLACVAMH